MKRLIIMAVVSFALSAPLPEGAWAVKPGNDLNPNGFLNGPHYNLNIHGKKPNFTCPPQEYDADGNPVYGNSAFITLEGQGTRILMQSGKKGGKAEAITDLQVIDPCARAFDGSDVVIQIPPGEYRVFGRALATPTGEPTLETVPSIERYEDSSGTSYFYMGTLTGSGFSTTSQTFTRKKGQSKAVDISGLFKWTGSVCYLDPADCSDAANCTLTEETLCCVPDGFGGFLSCAYGGDTCADELVTGYCSDYNNDWIFGIADFVDYLWSADNDGLKLLQVRFYPVD